MSEHRDLPYSPDTEADVCLLLEGTWPYVRGGVSSWVAQLIENQPETTFSVIFIGARAKDHESARYPIPDNVVHFESHFLLQAAISPTSANKKNKSAHVMQQNADMHDCLRSDDPADHKIAAQGFTELLTGDADMDAHTLETDPQAWKTIRDRYLDAPEGLDFNHYFWSVRSMHTPLFLLGRIAKAAPLARVYHSVSTGYAGALGAMIKQATGRPYVISEHGIYTKEREIDLGQVSWIPDAVEPFSAGLNDGMGYLRELWIRFFVSLGRMSYASADQLFTLYGGNRERQIADGAAPEKLRIIPNGVDVGRFAAVRCEHDTPPPVLLLIGRVVPIKDVKTFVRAMQIIKARLPEAEAWILGPVDEDPAYHDACLRLVASLDLQDTIKFLGFGKPEETLPKVGLNILTSISEGQPLTILEGFAAGVPAVTTRVGSCAELVCGVDADDEALGDAGAVVSIADPAGFADAALALLTDPAAWKAARRSAIARVEKYYDERDMLAAYAGVYADAIEGKGKAANDVEYGHAASNVHTLGKAS